jgi:hypothetical protein
MPVKPALKEPSEQLTPPAITVVHEVVPKVPVISTVRLLAIAGAGAMVIAKVMTASIVKTPNTNRFINPPFVRLKL